MTALLDPYAELRRWVREAPQRTFLVDAEGEYSFEYTGNAVAHLARRLRNLGLVAGDRVGIWLPNCREFVFAQLACHALGAVAVPLNPRLRKHDLAFALDDCTARFLVLGRASSHLDYHQLVQELQASGGLPALEQALLYSDDARDGDQPAAPLDVPVHQPADPAFIMFTSGTTADPKGVVLTRRNIRNAVKIAGGLSAEDVTLLGYPLSAITGCHNGVLASVVAGSALVLYREGDLTSAARLSAKYGATHLAVHRQVLLAFAAETAGGTSTFRKASIFPRMPADAPTYERLGVEQVVVGYGMTETCGPAMYGSDLSVDAGIGSGCDGWASHGVERLVVDVEGNETATGEQGEILLRGPQVSPGYWNGPGEYAAITDAEGWLRTGDIGEVRGDGSLHFIERRSETFKSHGFTVSPGEIENLIKAQPGVDDCAVLGLAGETSGTVPVAVVEPANADPDELYQSCKESLASYKVPRAILCVPALPRTRTGKPAKREIVTRHGAELRKLLA